MLPGGQRRPAQESVRPETVQAWPVELGADIVKPSGTVSVTV